jgi:uncharacterized phage protein gp47/JayE
VPKSPADISANIIATLNTTAPGLSCELGTPERKIIDACSEAISAAYVSQYLTGSLLDMDTKVGLELEQFVGIFGFGRLQGQPAKGVVRMTVNTPNTVDTPITLGTYFSTKPGLAGTNGTLNFATTQAAVLTAGTYSVDIPVECTINGSVGNVAPDSIVSVGSQAGAGNITNLAAMTGGADTENDSSLRQRFKDTMLRNIAGTKDWYISLALQNVNVTRATVIGPIQLFKTQIQVPSVSLSVPVTGSDGRSVMKYIWKDGSSVFTDLGQATEQFYIPDTDYTLTGISTPTFTRSTGSALSVNDVVDLELQYTPNASRNDPANKVTNKVDVFVDGVDPYPVTERTVTTSRTLSAVLSDPLYNLNFERVGTLPSGGTATPPATSRFVRLGSVPIVSFPPTLTIAGTVYRQGTDYCLIRTTTDNVYNDTTLVTGSHREISGIEWLSGRGPANGQEMTLKFVYNRVPEVVNSLIVQNKQITTDVLVHQADYQYIQPCLSIEYDRAYSISVVDTAIVNRLQTYFQGLGFGASVKVSNICLAVQQCLGVVDVKLTSSSDNATYYGIQIYENPSDTLPTRTKTEDFKLADNQVLMYRSVKLLRKATT